MAVASQKQVLLHHDVYTSSADKAISTDIVENTAYS